MAILEVKGHIFAHYYLMQKMQEAQLRGGSALRMQGTAQ